MPKRDINYQNCLMYKIVCNDLNVTDLYVGSTTNFSKRKQGHKSKCNNENDKCYNLKVYKMIRENGGWDNWSMIQIEEYPCNNNNEAFARERYWLETLNAKLNIFNPIRTKLDVQEYGKQYRIDNYDEVLKRKQNYRENNKEKINEKSKLYREQNIDKIKEQNKIQVTCPACNCTVTKCNFTRHKKSKSHIDAQAKLDDVQIV